MLINIFLEGYFGALMLQLDVHIWVWFHEKMILMKAVLDFNKGILKVYEDDRLLLIRTGLTKKQLKQIENRIRELGGKRLETYSDPFVFL